MALTLTLLAAAFLMSVMVVPLLQRRVDRRRLAGGPESPPPLIEPATTRPDGAILARSVDVGSAAPAVLQSTSLFVNMKPDQRGHTAIGAKPGDGKTQTGIALMVRDIAHGAEVYWLNPQYTYYHPIDQPTDLRPIKHLFTAVDDYRQILAILKAAHTLGEQRKPLYKAGLNVGHNIVLHLDEWPAIFAELGDEVSDILQRLLRECRKLNIWVVLGAQDFLVKTTGFSSGVRSTFNTKLVGNVDRTTWGELLGGSQDKQPVAKGTWMTEDGLIQVVRPQARLIESMAAVLRPHNVGSLVSTILTDQEWLSAELEPESDTEVRRLAASIDGAHRTGSDRADASIFEGEPITERTGSAPAVASEIVGSDAIKPVRNDLPQDTLSKAIRALVQVPISRTQIIDLLSIGGGKAAALKRIKTALGEE